MLFLTSRRVVQGSSQRLVALLRLSALRLTLSPTGGGSNRNASLKDERGIYLHDNLYIDSLRNISFFASGVEK